MCATSRRPCALCLAQEDDDFKIESCTSVSVKAEKLREYLERKFGQQKFNFILREVQNNIDNIAKVPDILSVAVCVLRIKLLDLSSVCSLSPLCWSLPSA